MTYEEEIAYREELLQKARDGMKVTSEERLWSQTHSVYNRRFGFPYYNVSIETLEPNQWYSLAINMESIGYKDRILPIISVPAGKGQIITDFELTDLRGNKSLGKPVKMLGLTLDLAHRECNVKYYSALGILAVGYECDYLDTAQNLHMRESSSTGATNFAMTKQMVNDHMVRYHCKSPVEDSFDAMIFTIKWTKCNAR